MTPALTPDFLSGLEAQLAARPSIIITCHKSPDGDAIGSSLALYHTLQAQGHDVQVVVPDPAPDFLAFMPGYDTLVNAQTDMEAAEAAFQSAGLVFCLDYNHPSRAGGLQSTLEALTCTTVIIDHHLEPSDFATLLLSDTNCCSTAQLIYDWVEASGRLSDFSLDAAACVYTGLVTDTGSFRFSSVDARTHRIAAALKEQGLATHTVHESLFDSNRLSRLKLMGHALLNKLIIVERYRTAIIPISLHDMDTYGYQSGDTEGFVNLALSLEGIEFAVLIKESEEYVKLSLRSKGDFPANEVAAKFFDGGGHKNAAGGRHDGPLEATVQQLRDALPDFEHML